MINLRFILLLLALMVMALAAVDIKASRVNLLALGLCLWLLAVIVA